MKNLNPQISDESESSLAIQACITHKSREIKLNVTGDFDAQQTVEQMAELVKPAGYFERIVLDFSCVSRIRAIELYRLFVELSASPHFNYIEIRIEGLQFSYEIGKAKVV